MELIKYLPNGQWQLIKSVDTKASAPIDAEAKRENKPDKIKQNPVKAPAKVMLPIDEEKQK